ncbi:MAG TPA: hypothetical protein VEA69_03930 [Tepidisphaeraceae bacterium]|nr:hypothetical protein [Tepidisphaeraceae bacterium]
MLLPRLAAVALCLILAPLALADWKLGDKAVVAIETEMKQGPKTVATLTAGQRVVVTEVRGAWVGVAMEADLKSTGWVPAARLAPADAPAPVAEPKPAAAGAVSGKPEALVGKWTMSRLIGINTGAHKSYTMVGDDHAIVIKTDAATVTGSIDGKATTIAYTLKLDATARPPRYTLTNSAKADDTETGIYHLAGDTLMLRPVEFGKGAADWSFSGVRMDVRDSSGGDDSAIPEGFVLPPGGKGYKIMEFTRAK